MQKPVTELAVKRRINRHLVEKGECLRKCASNSRWLNDLGKYYIVDINTDNVVKISIDLEAFAREEGVMKSGEAIVAEM